LPFGEFEIKHFAGGIFIPDRRTAMAFVITLQPHCRLSAHWRAAEKALNARGLSERGERLASRAFADALVQDGWEFEWTAEPRTLPKIKPRRRHNSKKTPQPRRKLRKTARRKAG